MTPPDHPPTAAGPASSPPAPADRAALHQGAAEHDLWEFEAPEPAAAKTPSVFPDAGAFPLPAGRGLGKKQLRPVVRFSANDPNGSDGVTKIDFAKSKPTSIPPSQVGQPTPGQDFDDLDSWEDSQRDTLVIKVSPDLQPPPVAGPEEAPPATTKSASRRPASSSEVTLWQLISRVKLSFFELCGLFLLLGLLTAGGIAIYFSTVHRLPSKPAFAKAQVFPVTGEHLTLVAASTYWRPPAADETVRRGTKLLPALSFKATGGPATLRVFFRDSEGDLVGDAVTQPLKSGSEIEISATSGFEDRGMHAGYRTGQDPPWTIEICEAPAGTSLGADFKTLLTLPVSTLCH